MQIFTDLAAIPAGFGPSVVTIGKFNGVHVGHAAMLQLACDQAAQRDCVSVVLTFDRHPAALLHPERVPEDITGVDRRFQLIEGSGADATVVLPFTQELADLSARDFVTKILVNTLHAESVVVGRDFRFGHNAEGTVQTLRDLAAEFGFDVTVIADVCPDGDERASSSLILRLIESGEIARANRLLGRNHAMRGEIVHGDARGRELGFPTANLSHEATGFMPTDGTYAGWLTDEDGARYPVAISVGTNPSFPGKRHRRVEAFVLDHTLDLYGHVVVIEFVERLRGMFVFDDISELIATMHNDVKHTREVLGLEAAS